MFSNKVVVVLKRTIVGMLSCCVMISLCQSAAIAGTGYDALDDAALKVKSTTQTPLVTVIRVGRRLLAAGLHGVIIFSDNNGKTWEQAEVPVDLTLTALYFSSGQQGWAVGHYGVILATVDGGATWKKVVDGLNVIAALSEMSNKAQKSDASIPSAQLELRVARAFKAAGPNKPFLAIGPCGNGILAAGQQDMAMFTLDSGKFWHEWTSHISNPSFQNIYAVLNTKENTWLVGEGGLFFKGDKNCSNFIPVPGPYTATLFDGLVFGQDSILLFGLDGGLFRSDDGGTNWTTLVIPLDSVIDAGIILPSDRILLGTLSGGLYLSDSTKNIFTALPFTEPFQIAAMAVASNGNVIAVGNGGVETIPAQLIK